MCNFPSSFNSPGPQSAEENLVGEEEPNKSYLEGDKNPVEHDNNTLKELAGDIEIDDNDNEHVTNGKLPAPKNNVVLESHF